VKVKYEHTFKRDYHTAHIDGIKAAHKLYTKQLPNEGCNNNALCH